MPKARSALALVLSARACCRVLPAASTLVTWKTVARTQSDTTARVPAAKFATDISGMESDTFAMLADSATGVPAMTRRTSTSVEAVGPAATGAPGPLTAAGSAGVQPPPVAW